MNPIKIQFLHSNQFKDNIKSFLELKILTFIHYNLKNVSKPHTLYTLFEKFEILFILFFFLILYTLHF